MEFQSRNSWQNQSRPEQKLDYSYLLMKQIDRCSEAMSTMRPNFTTTVTALETILRPHWDKDYIIIRKKINLKAGDAIRAAQANPRTDQNTITQIQWSRSRAKFLALMDMIRRKKLLPDTEVDEYG